MGRFGPALEGGLSDSLTSGGSRVRLGDYLRLLRPYFWPTAPAERVSALSCFALLGLSKACGVASPLFLGRATDALVRGRLPVLELLVFGALRFGVTALEEAQKIVYLRTKEVAYREIACRAFEHLHTLSLHWHISKRSGVVLRAMDRGINSASTIVDFLFLRLVPTLIEMFVLLGIFAGSYNSGPAAAALAIGFTSYIAITVCLTRSRRAARAKERRTDNEANSIAVESLGAFETVKSFGNEDFEANRYSKAIIAYQSATRETAAVNSIINIVQSGIIRGTITAVLILAGLDVIAGRTSLGDWVALQVYVASLFMPLSWLGTMLHVIVQSITDMRNLVDLLLEVPEPRDAEGAGELRLASPARGVRVEFQGVTFRYPADTGAANRVEAQMEEQRRAEEARAAGAAGRSLRGRLSAAAAALGGALRRGGGHVRLAGAEAPGAGGGLPPAAEAERAPLTARREEAALGHVALAVAGEGGGEGGGGGRGEAAGGVIGAGGASGSAPQGAPQAAQPPSIPRGDRIVLRGVSFVMEPGTTTALVGHTGCGKSTLARLLFRFYDVLPGGGGGCVRVDGADVRSVTQASLRAVIGIVPQDTVLFNESLEFNIRYGRPEASDAQVAAAAAAAHLGDFLRSLPEGLRTKVGERGLKLSGGEKQRVAIARAILKNPPLLILDEATSALDTLTEASVQAAISALRSGRTTLTIAHRLSTIKDADAILVLEQGAIVERGTHAQLLELQGGRYAEMWRSQRRAEAGAGAGAGELAESARREEGGGVGSGGASPVVV